MKDSHAKILLYLKNRPINQTYVLAMAANLKMDYQYLRRMLFELEANGQVQPTKFKTRKYYKLTTKAKIQQAIQKLTKVI